MRLCAIVARMAMRDEYFGAEVTLSEDGDEAWSSLAGNCSAAVCENGGDKLVHGSGGNVPAAGGAKVCHL